MFCEKCGTQLQDSEKFCPVCGTPAPDSVDAAPAAGQAATENASVQSGQTQMPAYAAPSFEEVPNGSEVAIGGGAMFSVSDPTETSQPVKEKKKSKKKFFVIGGIVAAAALIGVVTFAFELPARIGNWWHKTVSSPEKYYQYVEKGNAEKMASSAGELYQTIILDSKDFFNSTSNMTITLEVGEGGKELLELAEKMAGMDLSWFENVSFGEVVTIDGNQFGLDLSTTLNSEKLLSMVMALDLESGKAFLQIPELTSTYLGLDLEELLGISFDDVVDGWEEFKDDFQAVIDAMPSQSRMEKMLIKYVQVATDCIDDVEKRSTTLKVEDVSQKCTALEITLDAELVAEMLKAVLEEAEDDADLEAFIVDIVDALGGDGDDVYDEFIEGLEYLYDDIKDVRGGDEEVTLTLYVDGKGNVIGRLLEAEGVEIAMLMAQSGGKFGYELSMYIDDGEESMGLYGSGKISGDKISGEFSLNLYDAYNGGDIEIMTFTTESLDLKSLKQGMFNGKIVMSPGSELVKQMTGGSPYVASIIRDLKFSLSGKSSADSAECTFGVIYDDKDLISLTASSESKKSSGVNIPKDKNAIFIEDERDLEDWFDEIDWDKFISGLKKTNLPKSVISEIEDICEEIEDGGLDMLGDVISSLMWNYGYPSYYYDGYYDIW